MQKLRQQGGIHRILAAMKNFESSEAVQRNGCAVLGHFVAGPTTLNQEALSEQGGVEAILRAMQNHLDTAPVQQAACQALYFLGWGQESICIDIQEGGGIELIKRSVLAHPYHHGVQYWAKNANAILLGQHNVANPETDRGESKS